MYVRVRALRFEAICGRLALFPTSHMLSPTSWKLAKYRFVLNRVRVGHILCPCWSHSSGRGHSCFRMRRCLYFGLWSTASLGMHRSMIQSLRLLLVFVRLLAQYAWRHGSAVSQNTLNHCLWRFLKPWMRLRQKNGKKLYLEAFMVLPQARTRKTIVFGGVQEPWFGGNKC